MNSKSKPKNNPKTGSKMTPKNIREIKTNSTEGCHLLTQKHQLCPGEPNFKPGPILVDEFTHLHLESHLLTNQSCTFYYFHTSTMDLTLAPFFLGKNTQREGRRIPIRPTLYWERQASNPLHSSKEARILPRRQTTFAAKIYLSEFQGVFL